MWSLSAVRAETVATTAGADAGTTVVMSAEESAAMSAGANAGSTSTGSADREGLSVRETMTWRRLRFRKTTNRKSSENTDRFSGPFRFRP